MIPEFQEVSRMSPRGFRRFLKGFSGVFKGHMFLEICKRCLRGLQGIFFTAFLYSEPFSVP